MTRTIILLPEAERDISKQVRHLHRESQNTAVRFVKARHAS